MIDFLLRLFGFGKPSTPEIDIIVKCPECGEITHLHALDESQLVFETSCKSCHIDYMVTIDPVAKTAVTEDTSNLSGVNCPVCGDVDFFAHGNNAVKLRTCEECESSFIVRFDSHNNYETEIITFNS